MTNVAHQILNLAARRVEADALLVEQRRLRIVSGREVRVDGLEVEVLAGEQLRQRPPEVVEAEAEPVHAGVDLQVIADALAVLLRRRLHRVRGAGRGDGRRQAAIEQPVQIADAQRAEHQDVAAHTRRPQRRAFLDVGAGEQIGAGVFEGERDLPGAVSVGIRLDHRNHPGGARAILREIVDDVLVVGLERVKINPRDRLSDHIPVDCSVVARSQRVDRYAPPPARFSKRVNSRMNASFTTPVGPLRCLAMISSAVPCASVGGWLLS